MTASYALEHGPRQGESIVFLHGGNVAGWMWQPQVQLLPDRHLLTPDLPAFGERYAEPWPGTAGAADDISRLIGERAVDGRAHVVGLSLGALVALQLVARHPGLVRTCIVTGAIAAGVSGTTRALMWLQLALWPRRWFWAAQARAYGLPQDARELFIRTGMRVRTDTAAAVSAEVRAGVLPDAGGYAGPLLAVAGGRENPAARRAFGSLRGAFPQLQTWVAPGMHHAWSIEDPELFTRMVVGLVDEQTWQP